MASYVQHCTSVDNATDGQTFVFGSNCTAGNHIVVVAPHSYSGCPPSITDSQGNTYTARVSGTLQPSGAHKLWVFTAPVGSTAANTVTLHMACGNCQSVYVAEVTGLDATTPYETAAIFDANSGNPVLSGSVTTTTSNSFVVAHYKANAGTPSYTPGTGFTERHDPNVYYFEDATIAAAGAINPEATASSNAADVVGYSIAFRAAAGGGGSLSIPVAQAYYNQRRR